nr:integrase, catalytic region, zinc finger, CCHC-type, peptidase aspartic, catalytic [Tanacetum cinerariifolium]
HVAKIMGYRDYQIGNVTISRVYYVEGLGHNLFSVGQFCDSDLEVAFRQYTCFIHNLDRVDLLTGSQGNNRYTLSLQDMMASLPICLLSKASKTKSWLWHRRLSHLNFRAINHLARQGLNGVVERHNCTLIEAARTMLIYAQAPLFLWAEAMATACKLQPKADIGIFIGYAPSKKPFRIYNRRTRRIVETIHVDFDELTAMTSEQRSSRPALNDMTPRTISSGLVRSSSPSTSYTKMENVLQENNRLLTQALSVEIVNIVVHDYVNLDCLNVDAYAPCVTTESELKQDFIKKECYETLLQQYHILETHCISLEVNNQLNTEIFQRDIVSSLESAPTFAELFEINDLKAQVQEKDTVILKLKEKLNSLSANVKVEEIETLNLELDHKVTKLAVENEHLKQTYKQLFDSIKSSRVQSKELCDDLINKVNLMFVEVSDLNASLQKKVLVITA